MRWLRFLGTIIRDQFTRPALVIQYRCGLCTRHFNGPYEDMRKSANGSYWCKPCQDEFDNIDFL